MSGGRRQTPAAEHEPGFPPGRACCRIRWLLTAAIKGDNMQFVREGVNFGGKELSIETGRWRSRPTASVVVRYGRHDGPRHGRARRRRPREGIDFLPLTVDYRSTPTRPGKIPGGFFKREGQPTEKEVLTTGSSIARPAAVPRGLALRDADHRDGAVSADTRERLGRARDHRRLGARCTSRTSRWRDRSPASASASSTASSSSTRPSRSATQVARPDRRRQP